MTARVINKKHGINTASGVWEIINETCYDTDDIVRLFNAVEIALAITTENMAFEMGKELHVLYYSTSAAHFVKMYGATNELRIVPPSKLNIPPIQKLSESFGTKHLVPDIVVKHLLVTVYRAYELNKIRITEGITQPFAKYASIDLPLHYHTKRQTK